MDQRAAGIVLAGGRSTRMGRDKAALEWHGSTLLGRTCAVLTSAALEPVVVVRAAAQPLPPLAAAVEVVDDPREALGPLQGLAAGLAAVSERVPGAFVCSTDLPFLHVEFIRRVLRAFADHEVDVVLPETDGHHQPLAAGYRTSLAALVAALVAAGERKPAELFGRVRVLRLDRDELLADAALRAADPGLDSLVNLNEPHDYQAALERSTRRPVP